jgi:hypothetical protein
MPTYTFINTETDEEFELFFKSWKNKDEYLEANQNIQQTLRSAPQVGYNDAKKPDEGFRDILRDIKKGSGTGVNINTF